MMDKIDSSKIFQQSSKDYFKGHPPIPEKYDDWPEGWRTTYYKAYPRLAKAVDRRTHSRTHI